MLSLGVHAARWPILALWTACMLAQFLRKVERSARLHRFRRSARQPAYSCSAPGLVQRAPAAYDTDGCGLCARAGHGGGLMQAQAALNNGPGGLPHTRAAGIVAWLPGRRAARAGTVLVTSQRLGRRAGR